MNLARRVSVSFVLVVVFLGISSTANAQLHKLNVVYTATSPYQSAAIIARDTGLFRKHGLDVTMIFITVLDEYAKRIPKAKTMKPEEFMDSSFVKKLDDEKFYEAVLTIRIKEGIPCLHPSKSITV